MLDPHLLHHDPDHIAARLATRGFNLDLQIFQALEQDRRRTQIQVEILRAHRNTCSKKIGIAKAHGEDTEGLLLQVEASRQELEHAEKNLQAIQVKLEAYLLTIPNMADASVPVGKDSDANVTVLSWGEKPQFDFPPKDHVDLGARLGLDLPSANKIAKTRFMVLQGQLAHLHRALGQFMLDMHIEQHGYTEVYVPYLVNAQAMLGTGQLPKFEADLFSLSLNDHENAEKFYLIPTAEVPVTNLVQDTILHADTLPLRYVAYTPCFRSEAGSYGRDTRGLIRQHQFDKVELVQIVHPEDSMQTLEALTGHAEAVLQKLQLPYRKVLLATGDMGFASCKTYDLEVWLPSQNTYREISSCSNMGDFQARRMRSRIQTTDKKKVFAHTLNGSGLAVGRTLIAILENYQQSDGSVRVPDALQAYLKGLSKLLPSVAAGKS